MLIKKIQMMLLFDIWRARQNNVHVLDLEASFHASSSKELLENYVLVNLKKKCILRMTRHKMLLAS